VPSEGLPLAFRKGSSTEGLLPILGYVLGDQVGSRVFDDAWGDRIAIILMTLAAAWAVVQRLRRGESIGWWIPSIAIYLFIRGIAGLIWGEEVFLGIGIALKVGLGLAALGSVVMGKPAAASLAPLVLPFSERHPHADRHSSRVRGLSLCGLLRRSSTAWNPKFSRRYENVRRHWDRARTPTRRRSPQLGAIGLPCPICR